MAFYSIYEESLPIRIRNMILDLRTEHLESGGTYETAPDYIRDCGIHTIGFTIFVDEELESYSILKYGN